MSGSSELEFFLGGHDLEMLAIRDLLAVHAPGRFHDRQLAWGAKASAYEAEIAAACQAGRTAVLVELPADIAVPADRLHIVDHHDDRAGRDQPTALEQVFTLLRLPAADWTRWLDLAAANDRGHVPAMQRLVPPATREEMAHVRRADRAAQGVTDAEETAAPAAVAAARVAAGGRLTVVDWPFPHSSPVADRLESVFGGPGYENLLVGGTGQSAFFGAWDAVEFLLGRFPGGWAGGEKPVRGYWGGYRPLADIEDDLAAFLLPPESRPPPTQPPQRGRV